jgi:AraC-like DNA-binding protein
MGPLDVLKKGDLPQPLTSLGVTRPVEEDARGIIRPSAGSKVFDLERHAPHESLRRFVDRYWIARWDVSGTSYPQRLLTHPSVNVTVEGNEAVVHGVQTGVTSQVLVGRGAALGILFRPAGFRPFLNAPMWTITDQRVALDELIPGAAHRLAAAVRTGESEAMVGAADACLGPLVPREPQASETTAAWVDWISENRGTVRVKDVGRRAGITPRQLQRRFKDHVGIAPKAVIQRYRFFAAAELARTGDAAWAAAAVDLGYSDQAHLTREFATIAGLPPGRYVREERAVR